jgi:hypothetical protein
VVVKVFSDQECQLKPDASAVKFDNVDPNSRAQIKGAVAVDLSDDVVNRLALVRGNLVQRLPHNRL